jgi:hypothetical protein
MAFPVVVIILYAFYKLLGAELPSFRTAPEPGGPAGPASLTGVAPATEEFRRVARDRELREFVAQLEAIANRQEWRALIQRIERQPDEKIRTHPVVRAMELLARTRTGERSVALEQELATIDDLLRGGGSDHAALQEEIRTARVDQMISRMNSWEILRRNTDLFLRLLGPDAGSPYEVQVRQKVALRYEALGDELAARSRGYVSTDVITLREARAVYQAGLRFLVHQRNWQSLEPISAGTSLEIERLVEKIRKANRTLHGPSIPFTSSDWETWTGRRGDPIHMAPGSL